MQKDIWRKIDEAPLYFLVVPLLILYFWYYMKLGQNAVFDIHDQLDERVIHNLLNARHLGDGLTVYPEMFADGVPKGGVTVSAITFVLYRFFSPFAAFMMEYVFAEVCAFFGMYACVKRVGKSSILAVIGGMAMMWLRFRPAYGLSIVGVPVVFFAFWDLYELGLGTADAKAREKLISGGNTAGGVSQGRTMMWKVIRDFALIILYGSMTHLVTVGYSVLLCLLGMDIFLFVKSCRKRESFRFFWFYAGSFLLVVTYVVVYWQLFLQYIQGAAYISHRAELEIYGYSFRQALNIFLYGDNDYIFTMQGRLMPAMVAILVIYGVRLCRHRLSSELKTTYLVALGLFGLNAVFALIYGLCGTDFWIDLRRNSTGVLREFQLNRFYWLYPGTWYICGMILLTLPVRYHRKQAPDAGNYSIGGRWPALLTWILVGVLLLPAAWATRQNSWWLVNKGQYKNHMAYGLISWHDFYAEDLMKEIRDYIGRDQSEYRVGSLGINPAVSQLAGFYTIDGYSNNYTLEYKHKFRRVIEGELNKSDYQREYYDNWGSRAYLLTAEEPPRYGQRSDDFVYTDLDLNTEVMRELGCEYVLSCAEVTCADDLGWILERTFEEPDSFYRIWLYRVS